MFMVAFVFRLLVPFVWLVSFVVQALAFASPTNIFLLAGQSNMSGRGGVINYTVWDHFIPPECQPNPSILRLNVNHTWEEAHEPLHQDIDSGKICGVGPGMPFVHSILETNSTLGTVGLVPCAIGSTNISQWAQGTPNYNQLVTRARVASANGGTIRALLWYQGESDTNFFEDAILYKSNLKKFFTDLRTDLQSPGLPVVQVALASGYVPAYKEIVREAQLGMNLANVTWVDAEGLPLLADNLHLTTPSQVRLGKMLADAYLCMLNT